MSILVDMSSNMRLTAIKTLLRNHPGLVDMLITDNGETFDTTQTPEKLDLIDPGDLLVRLSWDLWNGGGEAELDKALHMLAQEDFDAFVDALKEFSAMRTKVKGAYMAGAEND